MSKKVKILIGGGAGYMGSRLIPELLKHGYEVDVIDLLWFGNHLPKKVNVRVMNLFDCNRETFKGYDQFIFLAGLSNDPMAEYDPAKNFIYNAALPAYLAFECRQAGVKRFIYASSCSIYGYTVDELYDEDSPVACLYPYGISKLQGEEGSLRFADDNFSVIALRKGTLSGYSPRMRFDLIVNTMYKFATHDKRVVVNNPSIWRPILDIRDAISAYLRAIQADYSISGAFNIASGNYTVGQVGDLVVQEVHKLTGTRIDIEIKDMHDFRNYKVDFTKAKVKLGYQPQYDVKDTIEDIHTGHLKYKNFDLDKFYNIKVFKELTNDRI